MNVRTYTDCSKAKEFQLFTITQSGEHFQFKVRILHGSEVRLERVS